jgi:carbamoyl-phosphate synthase small subunit
VQTLICKKHTFVHQINALNSTNLTPALLVLDDGSVFKGNAIGKIGTTTGEICFNTGMTGYQEVFTDPSYFGQILIATNNHIGNYGSLESETESDGIKIAGLVVKRFSEHYSRPMADSSLDDYLMKSHLVGIANVDTRELTRIVRSKGAMNAIISSEITDVDELKAKLKEAPSMEGLELSSRVTTESMYEQGPKDADIRVAVIDLGMKRNIARCLNERGAFTGVFPAKVRVQEILDFKPDGIMLSNGPGDPAAMDYAVDTVKQLLDKNIPIFGICLGHQVLSLASGLKTYKMHHGHRGLNHPVLNKVTGLSEVTSQNHGFAVSPVGVPENIEVTHINLNDDTVEGIKVKDKPAFSVQYHPEAAPGPHDSRYLFDDFIELIKKHK